MKTAQSWSLDVLIATVLFVAALTAFFTFFDNDDQSLDKVQQEAVRLLAMFKSKDSPYQVIAEEEVNGSKLYEMSSENYDTIKNTLGAKYDFCVYVEGEDGSLVPLQNPANASQSIFGVGSQDITVGGQPCS